MSSWPRGIDAHGVVHYVHPAQGRLDHNDPWCERTYFGKSYGSGTNVQIAPKRSVVTCILCLAVRMRRDDANS